LTSCATISFSRRTLIHGDSYKYAFILKLANIKFNEVKIEEYEGGGTAQ